MPLTIEQAEFLALDEATQRDVIAVHLFLKEHSELAYEPEEVATAVNQDLRFVAHLLEKFDDIGVVESGSLGDHRYFRYLKDFPDFD
jgi:hypothetical protein